MARMEFIAVDPSSVTSVPAGTRHKIRVQVMKDFRRKEREKQANANAARDRRTIPLEAIPPPRPPLEILSPAVNQLAITQRLRDGWFPIGFGFSSLTTQTVRGFHPRGSAPVNAILDTIKLLHLGSTERSDLVLHEGRRRFDVAMNCLQLNLNMEHPEMAAIGLMIISMGISMSEMYSAITQGTGRRIWQVHVVGMSALVLKNRHVPMESRLERFLIARFRTAQLMYSLCNATPFPKEYAAPAVPSQSSALDCLLGLAFHVPNLLSSEKTIKLGNRRPASISQLTRELGCLAKTLNTWLEAFSKGDPRNEQGRHSSRDALDTNDKLKPEVSRRNEPAKLFDLTCDSLCRICLLLTYASLSRVARLSRPINTQQQRELNTKLLTCVEELRETTMRLAETAETPVCRALALRAPLHFLKGWYTSARDYSGLRWCAEMQGKVCDDAPYLQWDALLPWSLMPLVTVPPPDTSVSGG